MTATSSSFYSAPFELKGSLFTLSVLYLRHTDCGAIDGYLAVKARQAPEFFKNAPVVIDLEAFDGDDEARIDFSRLYQLLRQRGLAPVGVRHGGHFLRQAAFDAGLPLLPDARSPSPGRETATNAGTGSASRLITTPVRSGQQVYAADGDLVVLGTISAGAEVLADGHIHIYGPLRGRALAGAKGNTQARIFCQSLEAELVAIAGAYRVIEQPEAEAWGKPVHVYLADQRLVIEPLLTRNGGGR
ncbi:MAG: septum site-determining protein MinC [Candidatus Competibacterales bacterium]